MLHLRTMFGLHWWHVVGKKKKCLIYTMKWGLRIITREIALYPPRGAQNSSSTSPGTQQSHSTCASWMQQTGFHRHSQGDFHAPPYVQVIEKVYAPVLLSTTIVWSHMSPPSKDFLPKTIPKHIVIHVHCQRSVTAILAHKETRCRCDS